MGFVFHRKTFERFRTYRYVQTREAFKFSGEFLYSEKNTGPHSVQLEFITK